jgi:hypothetical protein
MLRHCMWHLIAQPLGRDWVCVCRGAGGRGDGGGAGWRALRGGGGNFDECGVTRTFRNDAHLTTLLTGRGLSGMVRVSDVPHCICGRFTPSWTRASGVPPPRMLCTLWRAAGVHEHAYARGRVQVCVCVCACVGLHEPHHSVISTRDHHRSSGDPVIKGRGGPKYESESDNSGTCIEEHRTKL